MVEGQLSLFDLFANKQEEPANYFDKINEERAIAFHKNDIRLSNVTAYQYTRKCDQRKMTAFFGEMGNQLLYIKGFYTYHHIVEDNKKNRALFEKEMSNAKECVNDFRRINYEPCLEDMYKCREEGVWLYAEKRYAH